MPEFTTRMISYCDIIGRYVPLWNETYVGKIVTEFFSKKSLPRITCTSGSVHVSAILNVYLSVSFMPLNKTLSWAWVIAWVDLSLLSRNQFIAALQGCISTISWYSTSFGKSGWQIENNTLGSMTILHHLSCLVKNGILANRRIRNLDGVEWRNEAYVRSSRFNLGTGRSGNGSRLSGSLSSEHVNEPVSEPAAPYPSGTVLSSGFKVSPGGGGQLVAVVSASAGTAFLLCMSSSGVCWLIHLWHKELLWINSTNESR